MALRGKKPEFKKNRFRVILYGAPGVGKTHFCCSFPNAYYIDTEEVDRYEHFTNMLITNNSVHVKLHELEDIINEVKALLSEKHSYKTLIIDSLSNPYQQMCDSEAERLAKKSKTNDEGTSYGSNTQKPKRLLMRLGNLLARLDMNVVVTSHEKTKYEDGKEIGIIEDIPDKIKHLIGSAFHVKMQGKNNPIAYVKKSRYSELPQFEGIKLSYESIENTFGRNIFIEESENIKLASKEQINEIKNLFNLLKIDEEIINKGIIKSNATTLEDMSEENINKWINYLKNKINQINQAEVKEDEI